MKLDRPAGTGVRFEPGVVKAVPLVPIEAFTMPQFKAWLSTVPTP